MRTQLKTASCSARLKKSEADLKRCSSLVTELKKQLRKAHKEIDYLKNGTKDPLSNEKNR